MSIKRLGLIILIIVITGFKSEPTFASNLDQKTLSNQLRNLELKVEIDEQKIKELKLQIDAIDKINSNNRLEYIASKKLLEISDKNLTAPLYLIGIIITLIAALIALIPIGGYFFRRYIINKIDNEIAKINKTWKSHKQEFKKLSNEVLGLYADSLHSSMIDEWQAKNFDNAITFGEKAVELGVQAYGETPAIFNNRLLLDWYRSDLAYFYAEKNRTDKAGQAIEYAKKGLESGRAVRKLSLIDNFLFILKTFAKDTTDMKLWIQVYDEFKEDIYAKKIRIGEEQEEFNNYYNKISKLVSR